MLRKWEKLPENMQTDEVRRYYDILKKKRAALFFKRCFDIAVSAVMLLLLSPVFLILAIVIKLDSRGPVFYRQVRVTSYGRQFRIFKFRTMVTGADKGSHVTVKGDSRVTRVGRFLRKFRLDELSQLIDVFRGTMTFVGTRPEALKYVEHYTPEMMATLLLPAGVTSAASILYKDEAELLSAADDADAVYISDILPAKMKYNLREIEKFGFFRDIKIMFMTVLAVLGKDFEDDLAKEDPESIKTSEEARV
ncbi:MAG: sugar transferase [Ruminococcaceae bacterium]|nr:sugar transferase [Oscillospiraceae bacterium]